MSQDCKAILTLENQTIVYPFMMKLSRGKNKLLGSLYCIVHAQYGLWLMSEPETACVNGLLSRWFLFSWDLILKLELEHQFLPPQPSMITLSFRSLLSVWQL